MNREQTEDLKAFEQRLMNSVAHIKGKARKWKVIIGIVVIWFAVSLLTWWLDDTDYDNYLNMFASNKNLCLSAVVLFLLYLCGYFERHNAGNIVMNRCRVVLHDFNMSCDEQGKLILKRSKLAHESWKHS